MSRKYAVAVLDIGMTNKKVVVYDHNLRPLESVYRSFPAVVVDGLETHDLAGIEGWFLDTLAVLAKKYPIKAISVSTHGATFVCVDANGNPAAPCIFYTYEPGAEFHQRFFRTFGSAELLQAVTGTPNFSALINPAKGMFFLKERYPALFASTHTFLNYPQYWGKRLTGVSGSEPTYVGCHNYLWDWTEATWSSVSHRLGVAEKLPSEIRESWAPLGTITKAIAKRTGLSKKTIVTMGIHDSNASLLPYLAKQAGKPFVLNSTGTWCVIMHPQQEYGFRDDELGKVVFFNQSAMKTPVKTAIFLGGMEYEAWSKLIQQIHGRSDLPAFDPELYRTVLTEKTVFMLPEIVPGSGQFPGSIPRLVEGEISWTLSALRQVVDAGSYKPNSGLPLVLADYERAFAVLNISLALQTTVAIERAGIPDHADLYIEGGFRKNPDYISLLAAYYPACNVRLTDIAEATSFGAAICARMAHTQESLNQVAKSFNIDFTTVEHRTFDNLETYRQLWLSQMMD